MSSSLQFSLSSCRKKKRNRKKEKKEIKRHSWYPKSCSSGFYPMGAGAPLLAGVTTCAAVHWTLCREAEKHLKENKTSWEGGSAPAQGGWAAGTARPLHRGKDVLFLPSTTESGRRGCAWRHLPTGSSPASEEGTREALRVPCGLPAGAPRHNSSCQGTP